MRRTEESTESRGVLFWINSVITLPTLSAAEATAIFLLSDLIFDLSINGSERAVDMAFIGGEAASTLVALTALAIRTEIWNLDGIIDADGNRIQSGEGGCRAMGLKNICTLLTVCLSPLVGLGAAMAGLGSADTAAVGLTLSIAAGLANAGTWAADLVGTCTRDQATSAEHQSLTA